MRTLALLNPPVLLAVLGLLAAGCGGDDTDSAESASPASGGEGQGLEGFFQPQDGETWTYRVQKELPLDVELSEEDQARRPERTDSGYVVTFERVRTCKGTREVAQAGKVLTAMEIAEGGKSLGEELYDIGPGGVFFRGWLPGDGHPGDGVLDQGVKLVTPEMEPGQSWTCAGADPNRHFEFRVIERAEIEVPAGKFEAVRIQITNDHRGTGLKRTVWFAENIGIVREEGVSYGPKHTRVRERSELVHFLVPSGSTPAEPQEALVTTPADPGADPDNPDEPSGQDDTPPQQDKSDQGTESAPSDG